MYVRRAWLHLDSTRPPTVSARCRAFLLGRAFAAEQNGGYLYRVWYTPGPVLVLSPGRFAHRHVVAVERMVALAQLELDAFGDASATHFTPGRIHSIETMGTVDGPGTRFVVFVQGCPMRCAYCHNPDTWSPRAGSAATVEQIAAAFESNRAFYRNGGITVSGGEPLLQPEFVADLFAYMHALPHGRVHTCLDSCGYAFDPEHPERTERVLDETDLVLLDIKHADPTGHRELTGCDNTRILAFGDELARRGIKTVIRHVVVPGYTDAVEECEALGRLIAPWRNVVGLEMLPYHTMGVVKYEQLGIPYKLEGVPAMDKSRIPELRTAVLRGMKVGRSSQQ